MRAVAALYVSPTALALVQSWRAARFSSSNWSNTHTIRLPVICELLYVMRCTREEKGVDADRREEEAQAGLCSCAEQPAAAAEGEARRTGA